MPESIEHNVSIIGRTLVPYHKPLLINIHITENLIYSNRTVSNSIRTIRQLTVLLEYIDLL